MTTPKFSTYIDRCTVLKGIGASTLALGGLTGLGSAKPNKTVFELDFATGSGDADDIGPNTPGWQLGHQEPGAWEIATFDGDGRLQINIDESVPTHGFRSEEWKKYLPEEGGHWATGHNTTLSDSSYIDPDWEDDGGKRKQTNFRWLDPPAPPLY